MPSSLGQLQGAIFSALVNAGRTLIHGLGASLVVCSNVSPCRAVGSQACTAVQVAQLGSGLRDMRRQSSVALLGRQRVEAADTARIDAAMSTATAAVRV